MSNDDVHEGLCITYPKWMDEEARNDELLKMALILAHLRVKQMILGDKACLTRHEELYLEGLQYMSDYRIVVDTAAALGEAAAKQHAELYEKLLKEEEPCSD